MVVVDAVVAVVAFVAFVAFVVAAVAAVVEGLVAAFYVVALASAL